MFKSTIKYNAFMVLFVALNTLPVHAIGKRDIPVSSLESGQRLEISPGYGLTINLMPVGKVNRAWLTDKSWLTIANENGPCANGGCGQSRFLYLQRIDKLSFDGLPPTVDGATLLNAVTPTGEVLQIQLVKDPDGIPAYTSVYIQPELEIDSVTAQSTPQPIAQTIAREPIKEIPVEILLDKINQSSASDINESDQTEDTQPEENIEKQEELDSQEESVEENKVIEKEPEQSEPDLKPDAEETIEEQEEPELQKESVEEGKSSEKEPEQSEPDLKPDAEETIKEQEQPDSQEDSEESKPEKDKMTEKQPVIAKAQSDSVVDTQSQDNQAIALSVLRGLNSQRGIKEVAWQSTTYRQAQDLIWVLKRYPSLSLDSAIARSRIQPSVAHTLIEYGSD